MRIVFGFAAVLILICGYIVCPEGVRQEITEKVAPSEAFVADIHDGLAAFMDYIDGPDDIQPETPATSG